MPVRVGTSAFNYAAQTKRRKGPVLLPGHRGFDYSSLSSQHKRPRLPVESPFPQQDNFRIGHYVIVSEQDDYLTCKGFDPNAKYPWSLRTPSARNTIKVAKPSLLMRQPFDGVTVNMRVNGVLTDVTFAYDDDELGKRTATWTVNGVENNLVQRIEMPYFPDDAIMAVEVARNSGYRGLKTSTVDTDLGGRLTWMDLNNSGRRWVPAIGATDAYIRVTADDQTLTTATVIQWDLDKNTGPFTYDDANDTITLDDAGDYDALLVVNFAQSGSVAIAGHEGLTVDVQVFDDPNWYGYRDCVLASKHWSGISTSPGIVTMARNFNYKAVTAGTKIRCKGYIHRGNITVYGDQGSPYDRERSSWHIRKVD